MPSCGKELKDPNVTKLKDGHPATGRYVYGTNDPNVDRVNPAFPDPPATKFRHLSLIWRQILSWPRCYSGRLSTIIYRGPVNTTN